MTDIAVGWLLRSESGHSRHRRTFQMAGQDPEPNEKRGLRSAERIRSYQDKDFWRTKGNPRQGMNQKLRALGKDGEAILSGNVGKLLKAPAKVA